MDRDFVRIAVAVEVAPELYRVFVRTGNAGQLRLQRRARNVAALEESARRGIAAGGRKIGDVVELMGGTGRREDEEGDEAGRQCAASACLENCADP